MEVLRVPEDAYLERIEVIKSFDLARKGGRVVMQAQMIATLTSTTLAGCQDGRIGVLVGMATYESSMVTQVFHV